MARDEATEDRILARLRDLKLQEADLKIEDAALLDSLRRPRLESTPAPISFKKRDRVRIMNRFKTQSRKETGSISNS